VEITASYNAIGVSERENLQSSSLAVNQEEEIERENPAITAPLDSQDMEYRKVKDEVPFSSFPLSLSSLTCLYIKKVVYLF
jgi:hypothetical protein